MAESPYAYWLRRANTDIHEFGFITDRTRLALESMFIDVASLERRLLDQ